MSGAADDRWRLQRAPANAGGRPPRAPNHIRDKPSANSTHELGAAAAAGATVATSSVVSAGPAWAPRDRTGRAVSAAGPNDDSHVSVGGFDEPEARSLLRRSMASCLLERLADGGAPATAPAIKTRPGRTLRVLHELMKI
ncbi:MAG: hypothetical protein M1826_007347 [Phylliscum demangeonii]|nr:MAG: hypothetical protein M1826_007347 [Phylliscum demangeonii]